jgi:hypothetical protein
MHRIPANAGARKSPRIMFAKLLVDGLALALALEPDDAAAGGVPNDPP